MIALLLPPILRTSTVRQFRTTSGYDQATVTIADQQKAIGLLQEIEVTSRRLERDLVSANSTTVGSGVDLHRVVARDTFDGEPIEACPKVTWWDGVTGPLGAWHLSETVAQLLVDGWEAGNLDGLSHEYLAPLALAVMAYGIDRVDELDSTWGPIRPTCIVLADLALFVPIGCVYGRIRSPDTSWVDVQPGYRFLAALEVVKREDAWIDTISDAEVLTDKVCSRLGWPPPRAFLELGASIASQDFQRHRDACRLRLDNIACFYDASLINKCFQDSDFLQKHAPIIRHPKTSQTIVWPDNSLRTLRDCFLARYCWHVMGGTGPVSRHKLLPNDVWYDELYENVSTRDQMIDLILETRPWARLERLRSIADMIGRP